jgi:hypothetical protein
MRLAYVVPYFSNASHYVSAISSDIQLLFDVRFEATETEQELSDDEGNIESEFWIGNANRNLWKASCIRAALSVCFSRIYFI